MKHGKIRLTRDTLLVTLGVALLTSQGLKHFLFGDPADPALVTAGTSILVSPLVLRRDEKKKDG